jgi:hypothetical protein
MKTPTELKAKLIELESERPTTQRDRSLNGVLIAEIRNQLGRLGDPDFCASEADRIVRRVWG